MSINKVGSTTQIQTTELEPALEPLKKRVHVDLFKESSFAKVSNSTASSSDGLTSGVDADLSKRFGRYAQVAADQNKASDFLVQFQANQAFEDNPVNLTQINPPLFNHPQNNYLQGMSQVSSKVSSQYEAAAAPIRDKIGIGDLNTPVPPDFNPNDKDMKTPGNQEWIGTMSQSMEEYYSSTGQDVPQDVTTLEDDLTHVLKAGVASSEAEVAALALKLQSHQEFKAEMDSIYGELNQELLNRERPGYEPKSVDVPVFDKDGTFTGEYRPVFTKEEITAAKDDLEARRKTYSEMTQMETMELQDAMQKMQQAYNMLSNVLKAMHDTAKAIIGNLRA